MLKYLTADEKNATANTTEPTLCWNTAHSQGLANEFNRGVGDAGKQRSLASNKAGGSALKRWEGQPSTIRKVREATGEFDCHSN